MIPTLVSILLQLLLVVIPNGVALSAPPSPDAQHLEQLSEGVRPLRFSDGSWRLGDDHILDPSPIVMAQSNYRYVTFEAYAEALSSATHLEFVDVDTGVVLDTVTFSAGSSVEMLRTIPLTGRAIRVRIIAGFSASGHIVLARALVPTPPADEAQQLTAGLTPLSLIATSLDRQSQTLAEAARAVAMLQIAEKDGTYACTGFLVAKDVLATAAHCLRGAVEADPTDGWERRACRRIGILFDYRSHKRDGESVRASHCIEIVALERQVRPIGVAVTGGQVRSVLLTDSSEKKIIDEAEIAFLKLDPALTRRFDGSERQVLQLGPDPSGTLSGVAWVVQHPWGDIQRSGSACEVRSIPSTRLILHRCSTGKGSSGAPIMQPSEAAAWRVVGMHTCCNEDRRVRSDGVNTYQRALSLQNFGIRASALTEMIAAPRR